MASKQSKKENYLSTEGITSLRWIIKLTFLSHWTVPNSRTIIILASVFGCLVVVGLLLVLLYIYSSDTLNWNSTTSSLKKSKSKKKSKKIKSKKCRTGGSSRRRKRGHSSTVQNMKAPGTPAPPSLLDSRFGKMDSKLILNVSVDKPSKSDLSADKFAEQGTSKTTMPTLHSQVKADRSLVPKSASVKKSSRLRSHGCKSKIGKKNRSCNRNKSFACSTVRSKDYW